MYMKSMICMRFTVICFILWNKIVNIILGYKAYTVTHPFFREFVVLNLVFLLTRGSGNRDQEPCFHPRPKHPDHHNKHILVCIDLNNNITAVFVTRDCVIG